MALFEPDAVEVRPAAAVALARNDVTTEQLLARHQGGDWGDVDETTRERNSESLQAGLLLYSRYLLQDGAEILVETAGDRSVTVVFTDADHIFEELDTRAGYAIWAATYDDGRNPLIEIEEAYAAPLIAGLPATTALDIGTGTGRWAMKLARRGVAVTAVDQSPEMLVRARQVAHAEGLTIDFRLASLEEDWPLAGEQFDLVICALMLSHMPNLADAARRFSMLLAPGGHLLVTAFHPDIIAHGWRTIFDGPGITYGLPNAAHTREGYLSALAAAGLQVRDILDLPLRETPPGILPDTVLSETGDVNFCLIILAQKPPQSTL